MLCSPSNKSLTWLVAVIVLWGVLCPGVRGAAASETTLDYRINGEYLNKFKTDFIEVAKSPFEWKKKDVFKISAIMGVGAVLLAFDGEIRDWAQTHRSSQSDDVSGYISPLGSGNIIAVFVSSLYVSGEILNERSLRKTALLSLESWLTSSVIVLGLKWAIGRGRPSRSEDPYTFRPFSIRPGFFSFPSGHSSSAFAVATVIADQSEEIAVDFLVYSLSTLVALSRIHDNKHWASDVLIGSVIGYFVGKKISALNRNKNSDTIRLSFICSPRRQGLTISFSF